MMGRQRLVGMELFCARAGESAAFYAWLLSTDAHSGTDDWEPIRLLFDRGVLSVRRSEVEGPHPMWVPVYLVDNVDETGRLMKAQGGDSETVDGRTYLVDPGGVWTRIVGADAVPFGLDLDAVKETVLDYIAHDVPAACELYGAVLGLETLTFLDDPHHYAVLVDDRIIAMGAANYAIGAEHPVPMPSWMLYFDVPDVKAAAARAVKAGAKVVIAPVHEDYNDWAVLVDPFGVTFGLSRYHDLKRSEVQVRTQDGDVVPLGDAARLA
jgi:predicted enzyme related to lactoylglutathione lyase